MVKTRKTKIRFQSKPPPPGSRKCHPRIKSVNGKCLPRSILGQLRKGGRGLGASGNGRTTGNGLQGNGRTTGNGLQGNGRTTGNGNERQLVEQSNLTNAEKQHILRTYFRPKMPEGWKADQDMWLNSDDIQHVMKQYEEAYPAFSFLGVVPIDFSAPDPYVKGERKCINPQFCNVDIKALAARGIKYIGAIFNLDPHFKGGSHWVACCINIPKNGIYYFDSYGISPPEQVGVFMKSFILQNPAFKLSYNGNRFQYGNSECGMYSCYFLIRMIMGESFAHFCHNPVSDAWMLKFRKVLFDAE